MKKKIEILIIATVLLASITATLVYASVSSSSEVETIKTVSTSSISKSSEIFEKLDTNSDNVNSKVVYDELKKENLYEFENAKYFVNMNTKNELVGIYSKTVTTTQTTSNVNTSSAKEYVLNKYTELNLPAEYELTYLEKFDDLIWQANFEKNYNGIYNKYESVKMFFIPDSDEIVALTVFNESAASSAVAVSKEDAETTAAKNLGIDSSNIKSATLSMEKANKFYDNSNSDTTVHSTWVIQSSDDTIVYVDAENNNVIGGDHINE